MTIAITEIGQQSTIMQQWEHLKKGGKSDSEIDREEEARAILSFAVKMAENKEDKNLKEDEIVRIIVDTATAFKFLNPDFEEQMLLNFTNAFLYQYDSNIRDKVLNELQRKNLISPERFQEGISKQELDVLF